MRDQLLPGGLPAGHLAGHQRGDGAVGLCQLLLRLLPLLLEVAGHLRQVAVQGRKIGKLISYHTDFKKVIYLFKK